MLFRTKNKTSLSQIYKGMILIMIPVLILSAVVSISLGKTIQKQSVDVIRGNMNLQVEKLKQTFGNINYCMMNSLNNNDDLLLVQTEKGIKKNNAISSIKKEFTNFKYFFGEDYHFYLYEQANNMIYTNTPKYLSYKINNKIQDFIWQYMQDSSSKETKEKYKRWNLEKIDDNIQILVKVYTKDGVSIGCWILLDTVEKMFGVNSYSKNNFMFLVSDGKVLTHSDLYESVSEGKSVQYYKSVSGKIIKDNDICFYDFYKGSFSILSIVDTMGNYKNNLQILAAFIFLLFVFIGVGIYLLYYIRMKLIIPISSFMDHLYHENELDTKQDKYRFEELKQADELYQKARQQIKELKIAIYEEELKKRKLEQDYFQVQIKPHFYLNCLNIIYNMAQSKRYEEIQKLSLEVSKYLRTLFRSGMDFISLKDEINHLKGYLNIQEIRYSGDFTYHLEVEDGILDFKILPLIVHTIVENSIKHTIMKQGIIHIEILITKELLIMEEYIKIHVWDTGEGFNEEVLANLQSGRRLTKNDGDRIGITNMLQRLEYVYQGKAKVSFSNRINGGAQVEILVPVLSDEEDKA